MARSKVRTLPELVRIRSRLRREGKTVVFTNGCFDLIHGGHVHLFRAAKALGDVLIVALNSDASIRRLKGPSRPIFPLAERFEVLSAFESIDYLTSFSQDTPQKTIAALLPDVLGLGRRRDRRPGRGRGSGRESRPRGLPPGALQHQYHRRDPQGFRPPGLILNGRSRRPA